MPKNNKLNICKYHWDIIKSAQQQTEHFDKKVFLGVSRPVFDGVEVVITEPHYCVQCHTQEVQAYENVNHSSLEQQIIPSPRHSLVQAFKGIEDNVIYPDKVITHMRFKGGEICPKHLKNLEV